MASKKKQPKRLTEAQLKKRRSLAAKKGWKTRRKNNVKKDVKRNKKRLVNAQLGLPKKKRKKPGKLPNLNKLTKKELIKIAAKQREELDLIQEVSTWVDAMPPEFLSSKDNHICIQPSSVRQHEMSADIYAALEAADAQGPDALDAACRRFSYLLDVPLKEVWTFWKSP